MELKGKIINVLGDSITQGHGTSGPDHYYVKVLGDLLGAAEIRNFGIGGTRLARQYGADNYPWPFTERYKDMPDDADLVIVFGGTNDYGHGDAPFGEFSDRTNDTYIGACHFLFSELIKKYPAARIVVLTPCQRACGNNPSGANGKPLIDYVDAMAEVASYYSLPVLDLYREGGICPDIEVHRTMFMPDGLHPNDAGAKRLAERIAAFLQTL